MLQFLYSFGIKWMQNTTLTNLTKRLLIANHCKSLQIEPKLYHSKNHCIGYIFIYLLCTRYNKVNPTFAKVHFINIIFT